MKYTDLAPDPWQSARDWVTEFDGAATELCILDFPGTGLTGLVGEILRRGTLRKLEWIDHADSTTESETPLEAAERLLKSEILQVTLIVEVSGIRYQLFIRSSSKDLYEVECVFSSDLVFPPETREEKHRVTFQRIIQFGLDMCEVAGARELFLGPEWSGDPRDSDSGAVKIWERFGRPARRKLRVTASEKPAQRFASAATPVPARRGESTGEEIGYFIAMITYPIVFAIFGSEIHLGLIAWRGNIPEFREMLVWGPVVGFGVGSLLGLLSAVMHGGVPHLGNQNQNRILAFILWPLTWGLLFAGVGLFVAPLAAWIRIGVLSYLPQLKIGAATGFLVGVVTSIIASRNWERPSRG